MPKPSLLADTFRQHESDYAPDAWRQYSLHELGMWVHLLATRSTHRANADKRDKDLADAQNYLDIMQEKLNAIRDAA